MATRVTGAFFDGAGSLVLREINIPPCGSGEVLVDVKASGVCGSDLHQFRGKWPQPPYVPGHEIAGIVSEVGPGAQNVRVGDRVCIEPFIYCRRCRYCLSGRYFMCPQMGFLTLTAHGGFSEKVLAPDYAVYRLADTTSLEVGALAEPLAVGVHGARLGSISPADGVLVLGAGTIGLMSAAAARHCGARRVYITARHDHQAQAALRLGVDGVFSADPEELAHQAMEVFEGGPDVVMEAVGSEAGTFQQAIDIAGKLGRVVLMGGNTGAMDGIDLAPVIMKELVIYGSGCYSQIGLRKDFELALDILAQHPEPFEALITHRFALEEVAQAFETAMDKAKCKSVKVMVVDR